MTNTRDYPVPDRSNFEPNRYRGDAELPEGDLGAGVGVLADGRPYRHEQWYQEGSSFVTVFFSTRDLEAASAAGLLELVRPVVVPEIFPCQCLPVSCAEET